MSFPARLHHDVPGWVKDGSLFHIRMRAGRDVSLIGEGGSRAQAILEAVRFYHEKGTWFCRLALLMPDHLHAMITFPAERSMSTVVRAWKSYLSRVEGVVWQSGFFDHRLRSPAEEDECWHYIQQNPVASGLVPAEEDWPWFWTPVDRLGRS